MSRGGLCERRWRRDGAGGLAGASGSCGLVALGSLWSPVNLPVVTDLGRMRVKMGEAAKKSGGLACQTGECGPY